MRRLAVLVAVVLAAPILLALLIGDLFVGLADGARQERLSDDALAVAVAGVLASDIVLPTPSGPVITLAGAQLGVFPGAAASWFGMTLGAVAAFALVRRWGPRCVRRLANRRDLAALRKALIRMGPGLLILGSRPLPVLAETAVVLAALAGLSWRRFLPPLMGGNLIVAAVFAAAGGFGVDGGWLPLALVASIAVPLMLTAMLRVGLRLRDTASVERQGGDIC